MSSLPALPLAGSDLVTERLVLRDWSIGELAAVVRDERLAHWAEDFPADGDRVIAGFVAEQAGPSGVPGAYGHRLIVERGSGAVVGSISLLWPPSEGAVELGYGVVPSRRGHGYAPEAVSALVTAALALPEVTSVHADVDLANPASVRVLEKAGLHRRSDDGTVARFAATAATTVNEPTRR
ncbi:GNAT family N-acetyltransferase [Streptomyces sp. NPDC029674]|uniref:GNAT family N-acetyltransferase n=1 Tax=Streptomyces sp. NPDC029674 TaxID=3365297 RepID=UPI00384C706F